MRQGVLVLRGAVHTRARTQPRERFHFAGSAAGREFGLFGGSTAWANGELLRGPNSTKDAFFGITPGGGGSAGDPAGEIHDFAPQRLHAGYCGSYRGRAEDLRPRAPAGAIGFDQSAARDA